jgi:origin recognition complex subunit 2
MTKLSEDRSFAQNYFSFVTNLHPSEATSASSASHEDQFGKNEVPEPAEQRDLLKSFDQSKGHGNQLDSLSKVLRASFEGCAPHLRAGFNFLCYGYGSKKPFLDKIIPEIFEDFNIFVLDGFSETALSIGPVSTFNSLLNCIQNNLFSSSESPSTSSSKASIISKVSTICQKAAKRPDCKNIILIHQLDSPTFRSQLVLDSLLKLTSSGKFSIIASIDNPGIVNLFPMGRFEKFNWVWMDCTSMLPYGQELNRFMLDACTSSASRQTPRAAIIVLQSLTSNSQSIFKLLANFQLSAQESQVSALIDSFEDEEENESINTSSIDGFCGMSFHGLFQKCQENFVVTAEANFKTQLTEFTDHDLFKTVEARDGSLMYFIPFYHPELRQIIQNL